MEESGVPLNLSGGLHLHPGDLRIRKCFQFNFWLIIDVDLGFPGPSGRSNEISVARVISNSLPTSTFTGLPPD